MQKKNGFTLIELLTVIAIIGLLASIVLASIGTAKRKSRDVRRLSDMRQIRTDLELYLSEKGQYPGTVIAYGERDVPCNGWDISNVDQDGDGRPFIDPLIEDGVVSMVPVDPLDNFNNCGNYAYYRYAAGLYGCDPARGDYYVLGVRDMEGSGNPHPTSRGWSCPGRNWQAEFEWVIGEYSK